MGNEQDKTRRLSVRLESMEQVEKFYGRINVLLIVLVISSVFLPPVLVIGLLHKSISSDLFGKAVLITIFVCSVISVSLLLIARRLLIMARITDESRLQLKARLMHAAKLVAIGELVGGVAHEINNPLAIISSQSGVIRDSIDPKYSLACSPADITGELDVIDESIMRVRNITEKLLTFVRKSDSRVTNCDVSKIMEDVVVGFKEKEFRVSNVALVREYGDIPDAYIDPDQMRQVFLNLLNNAGDAIEESGTVTLKTSYDGSKYITISISDSGKGIYPADLKKIFNPFYTTKEYGRGTGLGLSVSKDIIESFKGTIRVESTPGEGSSFIITLPTGEKRIENG